MTRVIFKGKFIALRPNMKNVIFVCTGNVCRSPMAEELFRSHLNGHQDIKVGSAGIGAVEGQPASPFAVEVMKEKGLDISRLRSRPIQQEMVRHADCIFVMTYGHLDSLLLLYPSAAEKTFMLREFQPGL